MAQRSIDLEQMVRQVLADMGLRAEDLRADAPPGGASKPDPVSTPAGDGELEIGCRVVTMADVKGQLDGIVRLVVPRHAVVTPAVRDELRKRQIVLVDDPAAENPSTGGVRLMLLVPESGFDPAPLIGALEAQPIEMEVGKFDCLVAATDALAGDLARPDTLALLVTSNPAIAVCLANRHRGVRAVRGIEAGRSAVEAASVGANLLVLDPEATSLFQLRQMALAFCRRAPAACPASLRKRLG